MTRAEFVPVGQRTPVVEARRVWLEAKDRRERAEARLLDIRRILGRTPTGVAAGAEDVDGADIARARADERGVEEAVARAVAEELDLEAGFRIVSVREVAAVQAARDEARRELVRLVFRLLEPACEAAERLEEFDHATEQLGARRGTAPFPELIRADGHESGLDFKKAYFRADLA